MKLGLSIFGSVRFWTKINNQTEIYFFLSSWTEPNRTENRFKPINFGSGRVGFFPFQTGWTEIMMLKQISDSIHSFSKECYKAYQLQINRNQFPAIPSTQISSYWGHKRLDRVHNYWFNQKHFQKQLPNITAGKELNRSMI